MSVNLRLAELLEQAAGALRAADAQLAAIPAREPLESLAGFWNLSARLRKAIIRRAPLMPAGKPVAAEEWLAVPVEELLGMRNFAEKSLGEFCQFLAAHGHAIPADWLDRAVMPTEAE